jgi:hypothetical protein
LADQDAKPPGNETKDDQFAVRVKVTPDQVERLLRRGEFDFGDHPGITENPDGTGNLDLFLSRAQIGAPYTATFGSPASASRTFSAGYS